MRTDEQLSVEAAIHTLLQHGFQACTEAANAHYGTEYLYAFERLGDEKRVYYCCETVEDLFALVSLVETSTSP